MNISRTKSTALKTLTLLFLILSLTAFASFAQKNANKGGESGGGGKGGNNPTPTPTPIPTPQPTNPLPAAAPAPDVVYRESFGAGPDNVRPAGSKGALKQDYVHTPLSNFWIEYPGSKDTQWIAPTEGQTWRFCGASSNPYEMFSPLQIMGGFATNGCVASEWTDAPAQNPTALMPVSAPTVPYEISFNGYPAPIAGKYLALGLTNSAAVYSNLETSGSVLLVLKPNTVSVNGSIFYELRAGGLHGTLLASGETYFDGWNQMKLRCDPIAKTIGASVNGTELGTYPINLGAPRYAAFEGVGIGDNFIVRKLQ